MFKKDGIVTFRMCRTSTWLSWSFIAVVIIVMFLDSDFAYQDTFISPFLFDFSRIIREPLTQAILISIALISIILLQYLGEKPSIIEYAIIGTTAFATFRYFTQYPIASNNTNCLVYVTAGMIATVVTRIAPHKDLLLAIALSLLLAPFLPHRGSITYTFHGTVRLSGPWENPNSFGLLMGVDITLLLGIAAVLIRDNRSNHRAAFSVLAVSLIVAAAALIKSYSRGAWVATACGLGFLCIGLHTDIARLFGRLGRRRGRIAVAGLLLVAVGLAVSNLPDTRIIINRSESMLDLGDKAVAHRIVAWQAAMRLIADHPFFGVGWASLHHALASDYLAQTPSFARAIYSNGYLVLAAAVGLPALTCMILLVVRVAVACLPQRNSVPARANTDLATCSSAAALVLAIGFFFDGGLFEMPTALPFFVLAIAAIRSSGETIISVEAAAANTK